MSSWIKNINLEGDRTIWGVVLALSLSSILVVYSTAGWHFLFSHISKLLLGLFAMYVVHKIKFKYFSKLGQLGFLFSLFLLVLVLLIGVSVNGASRWLQIAGQQFQPSDVAKLAILVYMARQISKQRDYLHDFKELFWYVLGPLLLVCILILPNNFSTSALVFINGLVMMFVGKIRVKFIVAIIGFAFVGALAIYASAKFTPLGTKIMPRSATWVSRIDSFFIDAEGDEQSKDFQQTQALVAIQNGGLTGLGPGKSTQRNILPYSSSDFIYAIIIEEYGLFGGVLALLFYLILMFRAIRIALRVESVFGSLLTTGLMFSLVFQALINMLVSVEVLPVTGQTLPLISMGGTSIVFSCIAIGIVLSVSRDSSDRKYEKV
ncbi:MAG: putative peptidoglycan glycosyltransferase FtsW [Cryomorphaceae bacterium]|nr:MAG: putative peptidoglycan glycosyltransferase FtsW [Cryomorphaceae bacterium]|tara:strand:- start:902 stop:2032 length:1131 start_codon:yes stop_codon:yes gene_type:complete